ncbi:MAG: hypothetical protein QXO92_03650, partial [Candidatus Bathyarchaeia archaeon]
LRASTSFAICSKRAAISSNRGIGISTDGVQIPPPIIGGHIIVVLHHMIGWHQILGMHMFGRQGPIIGRHCRSGMHFILSIGLHGVKTMFGLQTSIRFN